MHYYCLFIHSLLLLVFTIIYIIIFYYYLLLNMDINYSQLATRKQGTRNSQNTQHQSRPMYHRKTISLNLANVIAILRFPAGEVSFLPGAGLLKIGGIRYLFLHQKGDQKIFSN